MAIKFERIQPGMTLYDVRPAKGLSRWKWDIWPVFIKEVDTKKRKVLASWNCNPAEWISERKVVKYRAKQPQQVYRRGGP